MVSFSSRVLQGKRGEAGTSLLIPLLMYRNPLGDVVRPALLQLGFVWWLMRDAWSDFSCCYRTMR